MAKPKYIRPRITSKLLERFFSKIAISHNRGFNGTPCWEWTASMSRGGYGNFNLRGIADKGYVASYLMFVGNVPEGYEIDHQCRNRRCVAPYHLEAVTHRVNVLRGVSICAKNAAKTHCKRGHALTDDNVKLYRGTRACRQCAKESVLVRMREWRAANPERVKAQGRAYYAAHPEQRREYTRQYRAKLKAKKEDAS